MSTNYHCPFRKNDVEKFRYFFNVFMRLFPVKFTYCMTDSGKKCLLEKKEKRQPKVWHSKFSGRKKVGKYVSTRMIGKKLSSPFRAIFSFPYCEFREKFNMWKEKKLRRVRLNFNISRNAAEKNFKWMDCCWTSQTT